MNIMQMMKQAQSIQKKVKDIQGELANLEVVGEAGNGAVTVTFDGQGKFKAIKLSSQVSELDTEMLEDVITAAINQASEKAAAQMEQKMKPVLGGINIPGLF